MLSLTTSDVPNPHPESRWKIPTDYINNWCWLDMGKDPKTGKRFRPKCCFGSCGYKNHPNMGHWTTYYCNQYIKYHAPNEITAPEDMSWEMIKTAVTIFDPLTCKYNLTGKICFGNLQNDGSCCLLTEDHETFQIKARKWLLENEINLDKIFNQEQFEKVKILVNKFIETHNIQPIVIIEKPPRIEIINENKSINADLLNCKNGLECPYNLLGKCQWYHPPNPDFEIYAEQFIKKKMQYFKNPVFNWYELLANENYKHFGNYCYFVKEAARFWKDKQIILENIAKLNKKKREENYLLMNDLN